MASDRQGSNFESCQAVSGGQGHLTILRRFSQFSLYVHKGGLIKPIHSIFTSVTPPHNANNLPVKQIMTSLMLVSRITQGSHSHGKSWKTMENKKIKSRPGKVMEDENLAKSHGKVMEF